MKSNSIQHYLLLILFVSLGGWSLSSCNPEKSNTITVTEPLETTPKLITKSKTDTPIPKFSEEQIDIIPTDTPESMSFYVSVSGSDDNPGTKSLPWKTIQKAADTLKPGETVFIREGTYSEQVSLSYRDNSAGPFITFTNYPGELVVLDGSNIDIQYGDGLILIKKTDYIRISGLRIQHSNGAGILVVGANNIVVENNRTFDTVKSGIGIWASNHVVVDGNEIALACNEHPGYPASEENLSIAAGSSYVEIRNNHIHQAANIPDGFAGGEGINVKDGAHDVNIYNNVVHLDERSDGKPSNRLAFGLDGWTNETYNISFFNNIAYNNETGFVVESEEGATVHDIFIYNNIAYNNGTGFLIPNWKKNESSLKKNVYFLNNTAYLNKIGFYINSVMIENIVFRNNIIWESMTAIKIGANVPISQITSDHNLTDRDPKFIDPISGDFHLQSSSPAIDNGSAVNAPDVDMDNNNRPQGLGFDIGAYEYINK